VSLSDNTCSKKSWSEEVYNLLQFNSQLKNRAESAQDFRIAYGMFLESPVHQNMSDPAQSFSSTITALQKQSWRW